MGPLLSLARRTELVPRLSNTPPTAPRQLDLVFDDVHFGDDSGGASNSSQVAGTSAPRGKRHRTAGGGR